jgi:hypothetical protein
MSDTAKFYIVQLMPDLFRREAQNVGLFVSKHGRTVARFIGQNASGGLDRRKTRHLPFPEVYAQWIMYWNNLVETTNVTEEELFSGNGGNYNVIRGGEVTDTGADSAENIADYLYPLLVSTGGLVEALGVRDESEEAAVKRLRDQVSDEFEEAAILAKEPGSLAGVPHPVRTGVFVEGNSTPHQPSYTQENGDLWVMETIDFTSAKRSQTKDRAGWAAFMFDDIAKKHSGNGAIHKTSVKPVAIVRARRGFRKCRRLM